MLCKAPCNWTQIQSSPVTKHDKQACVLGLDIGTSGVRAAFFDELGSEIAGASVRTERIFSGLNDLSVIEPEALLDLVVETIDRLLVNSAASVAGVELISISCFWQSLVGIDAAAQPTMPVLGWAETRASKAAKQLRADFDEAETHARTGCRFHPSYWPAKLLWLRSSEPETVNRTTRWLSFSEYLSLTLFGSASISISMASGTGLLNQHTCKWDNVLLRALRIPIETLPEIAVDGPSSNCLRREYATRWPLLAKARLCPAIADGAANNIGAGCTSREKLALMIGTSGAARILYKGPPPVRVPSSLWSYRADLSRVLVGGALSDGGGLYHWFKESLLPNPDSGAITAALENLKPDDHGLTVLPFWAGERSPNWSLEARGGILGMTLETKPIEILRAAMEAIAYRFALIVDALDEISPQASMVATGNALQSSPVWTQVIADVLGRPVMLSNTREASSRGAALLALEATGKIPSIEIAGRNENEVAFAPDPSRHAIYQKAIERQVRLYKSMIASTE